MLVELDGLWLAHAGVKLEGAVIARTQGSAVIDLVIQEPCVCPGGKGQAMVIQAVDAQEAGGVRGCIL